jgi:putative ABC transport system permease protein
MKILKQRWTNFLRSIRVGNFLALRHLKRASKGTTALIIFIMVLTFVNLVVVSGLLRGLIVGSFKQYRESYTGEVIITPAPRREYIENSPALISFLHNHPRVLAVSARLGVSAEVLGTLTDLPSLRERTNRIGARIVGIDPMDEEQVTQFSRFTIRGETLREGNEGYVLIGANIIKQFSSFADVEIPGLELLDDVDVGKRIRVSLPRESGVSATKDFIVKGIIDTKVDEVSTRIFMLNSELRRMLIVNKDQYQAIAIKTDYSYAPQLVREITTFMGDHRALIQTTDNAVPSFLRDVENTMNILGNALSSIALVVASITIFIVVFINAVTKRKFIGIMKGIGVDPFSIEIAYILQAIFYGLIGSLIGLVLTFGLLKPYFNVHPIDFPFSDGILVADLAGSFLRMGILMIITILAGYIPAKIIVRKNTLDAILGR